MSTEEFYLVCFGTGLLLSVLSFAGGMGHLHVGHWHVGHGASAHGRAGASAFNGFTLTAFLCWFGGVGYLLTRHHTFVALVVFVFALLAGAMGASAIFLFLAKVLLPHERALLPEDTEMRGVIARVSSTVRTNGVARFCFR